MSDPTHTGFVVLGEGRQLVFLRETEKLWMEVRPSRSKWRKDTGRKLNNMASEARQVHYLDLPTIQPINEGG